MMTEMTTATGQICRFGPYEVSFSERRVSRQEQTIRLTPKVFDTLAILLQNRDRVMSKHELLRAVWPDRFVEEANLTQNISVLRKALGETDSATKYIATFPGKGYRFIADVEEPLCDLEETRNEPLPVSEVTSLVAPPGKRLSRLAVGGIAAALVICGSLTLYRRSQESSLPPQETSLPLGPSNKLTHLPGRAYQPAISPDGKTVAFVLHDSLTGAKRLALQGTDKSAEPYLMPSNGGDMFSPAWSPDSARLAYLQSDGSRLRVMIRDRSGLSQSLVEVFPRRYELTARQLDWSPDGRLLAVSDKESGEGPFSLNLVHIAEKRKIPLTHPPALSDGDFAPRFSPDGSKLAFVRQIAGGVTNSYYIDLPGSDPKSLPQIGRAVGDLDWTPDSSTLLSSSGDPGSSILWQVNLHTNPERIARSRVLADSPIQFSISRRTGRLVFGLFEPEQNVWRGTVDVQRGVRDWQPWIVSKARNYFPVYSHQGRGVAFVSERSGEAQLWIKDSEGKERQLTNGSLRPWYASWTGNDDALVFSSLKLRKMFSVSVAKGLSQAVPIQSEVGSHTAVSLDGRTVYFVRRFYIFAAPTKGGMPPTLLTDEGGFPLRMSPDGQWLYYVRNRFSNEIWRVDTRSGRAEKVTTRLQPGAWSAWSLAGNSIVYLADAPGPGARDLERLDLQTGQVQTFGKLPARLPALGMGALALSPDGLSILAVVSQPGSGDLRLISATPWLRSEGDQRKDVFVTALSQ